MPVEERVETEKPIKNPRLVKITWEDIWTSAHWKNTKELSEATELALWAEIESVGWIMAESDTVIVLCACKTEIPEQQVNMTQRIPRGVIRKIENLDVRARGRKKGVKIKNTFQISVKDGGIGGCVAKHGAMVIHQHSTDRDICKCLCHSLGKEK